MALVLLLTVLCAFWPGPFAAAHASPPSGCHSLCHSLEAGTAVNPQLLETDNILRVAEILFWLNRLSPQPNYLGTPPLPFAVRQDNRTGNQCTNRQKRCPPLQAWFIKTFA